MYVKVYGTIRVFKEEKAIVGTHIKKIEKMDEVTNHLLQVFVAHCIRKKGVLTNRDLHQQQQAQGQRQSGNALGSNPGIGGKLDLGSSGGDHLQEVMGKVSMDFLAERLSNHEPHSFPARTSASVEPRLAL